MFTERSAIEEQLHENKRAIRELRDSNLELIKRLREIDERDMKSSSIDIFQHLTESMTDIVSRLSELIPHVPATAVIEHIKEQYNVAEMVEDIKAPAPTQLQENIAEAVQSSKLAEPAPFSIPKERQVTIVKDIFVEHGNELKASFIENEFFKRTGKKYNAFCTTMNHIMELCPDIQRASRGRYIYKKHPAFDLPEKQDQNEYALA